MPRAKPRPQLTTIAARLKFARTLAHLPAREMDRLAGKTPGHAGLIEARPGSDAMAGTLAAYADVLGLSLDWLVRGQGDAPTADSVREAVATARAKLTDPPSGSTGSPEVRAVA
jgi:hypothetical protein